MRRMFASLLLLTAFMFPAQFLGAAEPPVKAAAQDETVRLVLVGDIMLDTLPGEAVAKGVDPFGHFAEIFKAADLRVGNLECVIAHGGEKEDKKYTFRAHPRTLPVMMKHFDAMSIANNHMGDYGKAAVAEQIALMQTAKFGYFGGGKNREEAHRPWIVERNGIKFAFLGYNEFKPRRFEAGPDTPGLAWSDDEQVVADIKKAREQDKADIIISFMHWGVEYDAEPSDRQKQLARKMIDAGADCVIGAHPHVTQTCEYYKGKLIVYSLGNFVFDGFSEPESLRGWLLRTTFNKRGIVEWDTLTGQIDKDGIPHWNKAVASPFGKAGDEKIGTRKPE